MTTYKNQKKIYLYSNYCRHSLLCTNLLYVRVCYMKCQCQSIWCNDLSTQTETKKKKKKKKKKRKAAVSVFVRSQESVSTAEVEPSPRPLFGCCTTGGQCFVCLHTDVSLLEQTHGDTVNTYICVYMCKYRLDFSSCERRVLTLRKLFSNQIFFFYFSLFFPHYNFFFSLNLNKESP